jgi:hypothetical protein
MKLIRMGGVLVLAAAVGSVATLASAARDGESTARKAKRFPTTVHADYAVDAPGNATFTPPNSVTISDRRLKGRFYPSGSARTGPAPPFNPTQFSPGNVVLEFDAQFTGPTGQANGLVVSKHDNRQAGISCSRFEATITNNGANATGKMTSIGGTGTVSRLRLNLNVTSEQRQDGTFEANGKGTATLLGKRRGLNAECRALLAKL